MSGTRLLCGTWTLVLTVLPNVPFVARTLNIILCVVAADTVARARYTVCSHVCTTRLVTERAKPPRVAHTLQVATDRDAGTVLTRNIGVCTAFRALFTVTRREPTRITFTTPSARACSVAIAGIAHAAAGDDFKTAQIHAVRIGHAHCVALRTRMVVGWRRARRHAVAAAIFRCMFRRVAIVARRAHPLLRRWTSAGPPRRRRAVFRRHSANTRVATHARLAVLATKHTIRIVAGTFTIDKHGIVLTWYENIIDVLDDVFCRVRYQYHDTREK